MGLKKGDVVDILEDIHFRDVVARGRVCCTVQGSNDKERRVDVYIPEINAVRCVTKTRIRLVPREEL